MGNESLKVETREFSTLPVDVDTSSQESAYPGCILYVKSLVHVKAVAALVQRAGLLSNRSVQNDNIPI
jgi:hypothetical protein